MPDYTFDPYDYRQTQNMWGLMKELRAHAPVCRPRPGFVYLARHADVRRAFRDPVNFSSAEGFRGEDVKVPLEECFLGELDGQRHLDLRALLRQVFRPGIEAKAEPFARDYITGLWRGIAERGAADLVAEFGMHIPSAVTTHLLGIHTDHNERVGQWGFELIHSTWPEKNATERGVGLAGAFPEFTAFVDAQITERRARKVLGDDLISRMTVAEIEGGQKLSDLQIRTMIANVLLASLSTSNLIGNLLYRFVTDREFERAIRARPELIPNAVEESLRFEPPAMFLFRTAVNDVEVEGVTIGKGERVILGIASGNRDERVFDRADEFIIDRANASEHLSFGPGIHLCIGNQLARMEARVVLETAMEVFEEGQLQTAEGYEFENVHMFLELGPNTLDVVVGPSTEPARRGAHG